MSIIINGMEMPKCCADCDLLYDYMCCSMTGTHADFAKMDSEKLPDCPLEDLKRSQGEWIPVSKRLPEDMQSVLIWFEYYRYGYYEDGYFNCMYQTYGFGYVCDGKWSPFINGTTGWRDYNIIAWQPLPEPYEKGGEDDG